MRRLLTLAIVVGLLNVAPSGQPTAPAATLDRTEHMISMRDGVRLYTQIYAPRLRQGSGEAGSIRQAGSDTELLPIVFQRTPYGIGQNTAASVAAEISYSRSSRAGSGVRVLSGSPAAPGRTSVREPAVRPTLTTGDDTA